MSTEQIVKTLLEQYSISTVLYYIDQELERMQETYDGLDRHKERKQIQLFRKQLEKFCQNADFPD